MRAMELPGIEGQRRLLADYPPDVLIRPDVSGAGMFDFQSARNLVEVGYREAMSHLEELQSVVHSD
jgi:predicted acylesterase/phospholipase RssA